MTGLDRAAADSRRDLLAQQRTLRRFLASVADIAESALTGDEVAQALLSYSALGLQVALARHFDSAEKDVFPLLIAELPMGPETIARWRGEHGRHTRALARLVEGGTQDALVVAAGLHTVALELLRDLGDEERTLLAATGTPRPSPGGAN